MKSRIIAGAAITLFVASMMAPGLAAQTFTNLFNFHSTDGANPSVALVQGADGNFYGTTGAGGANQTCNFGLGGNGTCGTVFKINPSGVTTTLYSFCSQSNCTDGANPYAALIQATDGSFYGTTEFGGANDRGVCKKQGCGTIFSITPSGMLKTIYSFCAQSDCADGLDPAAALIQATDGNFYGTTYDGGPGLAGTVFKITPGGTLTTLYSFCPHDPDCTNGYGPEAALIQATDGNFYGTTIWGGTSASCIIGCETVFKITPSGTLTTLYSFCSQSDCTDGAKPEAALVQGTDGNFYGTTDGGGAADYGTVFKITPSGTLTTLYSFCSQKHCPDGGEVEAGLVQATDANFYGTTVIGGVNLDCGTAQHRIGCGTVFKITPGGALTTLHSFDATDGVYPEAALIQATNGKFYGTTSGGGDHYGTVFSVSVGLGPFVETLPASGKIGAPVGILGTDLTGSTSVTFNGTPATFTVGSASVITTTVPAGATTGTIQVMTPSGTLLSNGNFQVLP